MKQLEKKRRAIARTTERLQTEEGVKKRTSLVLAQIQDRLLKMDRYATVCLLQTIRLAIALWVVADHAEAQHLMLTFSHLLI